jgi:IrrE N-terminal-like domain
MRRDHKVDFRREETIERFALILRQETGVQYLHFFNIVEFVKGPLRKYLEKKGRPLRIEFFDKTTDEDPAYVTFDALIILHVDNEVWELADIGDPTARFIIAHEIGHLLLHNHFAKAFSNSPEDWIKFSEKEYSAEWQANTFALYFLLPTHIVVAFDNVEELIQSCGVTRQDAIDRATTVHAVRSPTAIYDGEACLKCGNFTLVRLGTGLRCFTCKVWRKEDVSLDGPLAGGVK